MGKVTTRRNPGNISKAGSTQRCGNNYWSKKESLEYFQGINIIFLKTTTTTKRTRNEENLDPLYQETAKALEAHWLPWKHIYSAFSRWLAEMRLNRAKILDVGSARRVWNLMLNWNNMLGLVCHVVLNHSKVHALRYLEIFQILNLKNICYSFNMTHKKKSDG